MFFSLGDDSKEEEEDGVKLHMFVEASKIVLSGVEIKETKRQSPEAFWRQNDLCK